MTRLLFLVMIGMFVSFIGKPAESAVTARLSWADAWERVTTANGSSTEKRHEAGGVLVGDTFYLIGGRGEKSTDAYDVSTNRWTSYDPPPVTIHHFQATVWNNDIYIVSALEGDYPSEDPITNILIFDTGTNRWSTGRSIPSSRRRGSAGVVTYNDSIYVVSGTTNGHSGGFIDRVDKYNPASNKWTRLADIPTPRDHFTAEVINGKIVAAGGRQTDIRNVSTWHNTVDAVNVYDIANNSWATGDDLPAEGAGTTSAICGESVIVLGGETTAGNANKTVSAFDINTYSWEALPNMINGRHGGGAFIYDDVLHAMSGSTKRGGGGETSAHETLDLESCASTPTPPTGVEIVNLALNKTTSQSSTSHSGVSGRAVDGNTNGAWGNRSVTHTKSENESWWQVDLGSVRNIEEVKLWNRTDSCCTNRLSDVHLFISDVPFNNTTVASSQSQAGVGDTFVSGTLSRETTVAVNRTGRYVRVQLDGTNPLSLAEVQVFGH